MRCGGKQFLSPGNMAAKNKAVLEGEFIMGKSSSRFLRSGSAAALALYAASALVFGLEVCAPAAAQDYTSGAFSGPVTDAAAQPDPASRCLLISQDQGFMPASKKR